MTSNSDGTSKKDLSIETALLRLIFIFHFQFPYLTSRPQMISVRIRLDSAAVYHHDPNSVRT